MSPETPSASTPERKRRMRGRGAAGGGAYFAAFIGALVYYMQHATSFATVILGILKAIVWPAILVYHVMGFLKM